MAIIVQKYGGSSVADADKLKRVAQLAVECKRKGNDVVIVVSAMGKTTDSLLAQAHAISPNPDRRELDMLLSVGERISMALLAMAIRDLGENAISFTGSQSGIITNDRHADARIIEVRPYRIQDELTRGRMVIVAGYQGVSYRKEITTLGRGGSDTTAVALAAALGAERCEIYSDVDGIFTADPRLVPAAMKINALSHLEMQELAESGAKVLNAQAVEFARKAGIHLYARKTGDPSQGTEVRLDAPPPSRGVRAVSHRSRVVWLTGRVATEKLFAALDEHHAPAELVWLDDPEGETTAVRAVLPPENLHGLPALRAALSSAFGGAVKLEEGLGTVSLVGDGLGATHGVLRDALKALSATSVRPVATLSTALRLGFVLPQSDVEKAARALHRTFLEATGGQPSPHHPDR
ncbi:MAG: aspartate kinase [Myxococcota bacterium]